MYWYLKIYPTTILTTILYSVTRFPLLWFLFQDLREKDITVLVFSRQTNTVFNYDVTTFLVSRLSLDTLRMISVIMICSVNSRDSESKDWVLIYWCHIWRIRIIFYFTYYINIFLKPCFGLCFIRESLGSRRNCKRHKRDKGLRERWQNTLGCNQSGPTLKVKTDNLRHNETLSLKRFSKSKELTCYNCLYKKQTGRMEGPTSFLRLTYDFVKPMKSFVASVVALIVLMRRRLSSRSSPDSDRCWSHPGADLSLLCLRLVPTLGWAIFGFWSRSRTY